MSDAVKKVQDMTVEELEAQLVTNRKVSKEEHDAREKRCRYNNALKLHLARKTARCWIVISLDAVMDSAVIPVSVKVPAHYHGLTFTTYSEFDGIEKYENLVVVREPCMDVKVRVQTEMENDSGIYVRLPLGQSILVGIDSGSNKSKTSVREYTVISFATEAEAIEWHHMLILCNDPCPMPL